ncbi:MAG TPA: transketolase [Opitutae bacterium]|nr:transketolase [Opitutae bacterium]
MTTTLKNEAAQQARGLAIDAVHTCNSGHLGLPLGAAEIGAALFTEALVFDPTQPKWLNRDRFILSAGHGSMFLYTWLHLSGYDLDLEQLKQFRVLHSKTPGHPEYGETAGVEATTGPLGQGVGNAVGYALSGKKAAYRYNTPEHTLLDYHVIALMGDGCFQEGVAREAISFAGHNKLDNLILIYDFNEVTLDALAEQSQSEDTPAFFKAQGFEVFDIDGHSIEAVDKAIKTAKANDNGKPKIILARTTIAKGIPQVEGTSGGHGEGGAKFSEEAKRGLGLPEASFYVSEEIRDYFSSLTKQRKENKASWDVLFSNWEKANPSLAAELGSRDAEYSFEDYSEMIPEFTNDNCNGASRASGGLVYNALAKEIPTIITGSADLFGSTKNYLKDGGDFSPDNWDGRNIWFGIREHAMGAICNGVSYDGLFKISGATFTVFADYLRPSIRLAALSKLPVTYIFTHDSVGVGEDGPTHQPVETVSGLRVIPNLDVVRPGDAEEVSGAFIAALSRRDGPTAIILSRQGIQSVSEITAQERRLGVQKGAFITHKESSDLQLIILATGSELPHAIHAAKQIGTGVRVVSIPCFERFDRQSKEYQESILPSSCGKRIAVEAGVSDTWYKYLGAEGKAICIDQFGMSAPGNTVMKALGISVDNIVSVALTL